MSILLRAISKVSTTNVVIKSNQSASKRFFSASTNVSSSAPKTDANIDINSPEIKKLFADAQKKYQEIKALKLQRQNRQIKVVDAHQRERGTFKPSDQRSEAEDLERAKEVLNMDQSPTRYAYVLYSEYKKNKTLDKMMPDVQKLLEHLEKNKDFRKMMKDALLTKNNKAAQLDEFLKKNSISETMDAFLRVLVTNNRAGEVEYVLEALGPIITKLGSDITYAQVISAAPLKDAERNDIKSLLTKQFKPHGQLVLEEKVNPSLKGGYELFYDNLYHLDNTQRTTSLMISRALDKSVKAFMSKREAQESAAYKEALENAE